jgi:glycosyltransferase involved in cell wall biosynthesis
MLRDVSPGRVLVAIPAYNEEGTISSVVEKVRQSLPGFDLLVVDDGSHDRTGLILRELGVMSATHLCNLGYGRAVQTAIKYALKHNYDFLIVLDADGQHHPEEVRDILKTSVSDGWDVLIGSRYIKMGNYSYAPLGRRIGMQLFSLLVRVLTRQRVYDTTSGLKVIRRDVFEPLTFWHFVDFHAEAIVYLMRLGYRVGEFPITASERTTGTSMYSALSHFKYTLKTSLMVLLGLVQAELARRRQRP